MGVSLAVGGSEAKERAETQFRSLALTPRVLRVRWFEGMIHKIDVTRTKEGESRVRGARGEAGRGVMDQALPRQRPRSRRSGCECKTVQWVVGCCGRGTAELFRFQKKRSFLAVGRGGASKNTASERDEVGR